MLHTNPNDSLGNASVGSVVDYTPPGTLEPISNTEARAFRDLAERHATPLRTAPKEVTDAAKSRELTPDEVAAFSRWLETGDGTPAASDDREHDEHYEVRKHAFLSRPYARDLRVTRTHLSTHDAASARLTNAWPIAELMSIARDRGSRTVWLELPGSLFRRRSRLEVTLTSADDAARFCEKMLAAAPGAKALC